MAAALDAVGAALGALGLLAFARAFSSLVAINIPVAFVAASLAWLTVSVAAWYARRQWRSVWRARNAKKNGGSEISRNRYC
jgi:uncharacterized membrane protein